jgi:hypothetical protein
LKADEEAMSEESSRQSGTSPPDKAEKPEGVESASNGRFRLTERQNGKGSRVAWAWQDKKALESIRRKFDGDRLLAVAIAVYVALTETGSDMMAASFETTLGRIAQKAGTSVSSVKRVLPGLEAIPVIEVLRPPGIKVPRAYRLVAMGQTEPTMVQIEPTIAQGQNTVLGATLEESIEQSKKKREEKGGSLSQLEGKESHIAKAAGATEAKRAEIQALHSLCVELTGRDVELTMEREGQWLDWKKRGWSEEDLGTVVRYIKKGIKNGKRNQGALKFENLIGIPQKFESDLAEARAVAGRPAAPRVEQLKAGALKAAGPKADGKPLAQKTEAEKAEDLRVLAECRKKDGV